jgi:hypothetical protein
VLRPQAGATRWCPTGSRMPRSCCCLDGDDGEHGARGGRSRARAQASRRRAADAHVPAVPRARARSGACAREAHRHARPRHQPRGTAASSGARSALRSPGAARSCRTTCSGLGGGDIRPEHIGGGLDDLLARERRGAPRTSWRWGAHDARTPARRAELADVPNPASVGSRSCAPATRTAAAAACPSPSRCSSAPVGDPDPARDPACCAIVTAGPVPALGLRRAGRRRDVRVGPGGRRGLAHVARLNGEPTRVVCWAGDGGTFDIGMATLSAAAERNEDVLYVCYDNEIYGNTGGQRSSATPLGAVTTTTPRGKDAAQEGHPRILAAHRIPYAPPSRSRIPRTRVRKMRYARSTSAASASCTCSRPARPAGSRSRRTASSSCGSRCARGSSRSRGLRRAAHGINVEPELALRCPAALPRAAEPLPQRTRCDPRGTSEGSPPRGLATCACARTSRSRWRRAPRGTVMVKPSRNPRTWYRCE